ncbi:MAG: T9SS type A sorting domain-containing protein [Bacteroidales bacterium]|nr:T9SS type A sorting domain-containing protein [Bacteroidales bacterium]
MYRKFEVFTWEDNEYKPWETYTYFDYNTILEYGKWDKVYSINSLTNDTVDRSSYWYNSNKQLIEQILQIFDTVTMEYQNIIRGRYFYDEFGNDTIQMWENWNDEFSLWVNDLRYKRNFNEYNYITEDIVQEWLGNYWVTNSGYKYEYILNNKPNCPDTLIKQKWNFYEKGWDKYIRKHWLYSDSLVPTEYVYELWDETADKYINYQRFSELQYKNWPGYENLDHNYHPLFYFFQQQNWYDDWVNRVQYSADYDSLGGLFSQFVEYIEDQWVNKERYELRFNEKGLNIYQMREVWDNDHWDIMLGDTSIYFYDGNKPVIQIMHHWDTTGGKGWTNFGKFLYSDYIWYLGTNDHFEANKLKTNRVLIVPNPSEGNISIELIDKTESIFSVRLISVSGKVILQKNLLNTKSNKVEIKNQGIEKGAYIIRTLTKTNNVYCSKLIIN